LSEAAQGEADESWRSSARETLILGVSGTMRCMAGVRRRILLGAVLIVVLAWASGVPAGVDSVRGLFDETYVAAAPSRFSFSVVLVTPARGGADLALLDARSRQLRPLVRRPGEQFSPSWSADGRYLYFASADRDGTRIFRCDRSGRRCTPVTPSGKTSTLPMPSPDGSKLAYSVISTDAEGRVIGALWVARADGRAPRLMADAPAKATDFLPVGWGDGGRRLLVMVYLPDARGYRLAWAGLRGRVTYVDTGGPVVDAAVSPTENAFAYRDPGGPHLRVQSVAGVVGLPAAESAAYSPDGERLAFRSTQPGIAFVIAPAMGEPHTLVGGRFIGRLSWTADGRALLYWVRAKRHALAPALDPMELWAVDLDGHRERLLSNWHGGVPDGPLAVRPGG
jgi:hypothetical protein